MIRKLLLVMLMLVATPAFAETRQAGLKEVVGALEKSYASLQDVQADFSQKTTIAAIKKEQRGNGEVMLKRPASGTTMFRFDYTKPNQQIVSNGKQVWFYTPDSKQVIVSSLDTTFKGSNNIALSYLTGLGHVSRDFNTAFAKQQRDKEGNYILDLTPKNPTPVLSRLQLTVSAEAVQRYLAQGSVKDFFPVVSSVVTDAGGNETRISYSRPRVNKGIDSARFTFKAPKGVEVIKQ